MIVGTHPNPFIFRIFYDIDESIKLTKELESTGISAIGIHGRTSRSHPNSLVDAGECNRNMLLKENC